MAIPRIGEQAPPFRLPAAQGGEIGLDDFKGRKSLVLWFTKGMACAFCRQQMSQLARGYARFQTLGAEVLEVTNSTPARAQLYARQFKLPFPYLCDPDRRVRSAWGLEKRTRGPLYYAQILMMAKKTPPVPNDFGDFGPSPGEMLPTMADEDMGVFVVDRAGTVRYGFVSAYMSEKAVHGIPGPDELARELERCAAAA
jgi:peroxiredoxin